MRGSHSVHFSTGKDDWQTPDDLFRPWRDRLNIGLDVAANAENTKCGAWLGPDSPLGLTDALAVEDWGEIARGFVCWMNPPYSRGLQPKFVRKAALEAITHRVTTVALLPARTDTKLFHEAIWDKEARAPRPWVHELHFLKGRIRFIGAPSGAPFPSMVAVFGPPPPKVV